MKDCFELIHFRSHYTLVTPNLGTIELDFFMDGLPLHTSGLTQFWPILMRLPEMPEVPVMTVAIFAGESKPESVEDYLRSFVTELNYFEKYGILINGRQFNIKQRAIIADLPARAYIKGKNTQQFT